MNARIVTASAGILGLSLAAVTASVAAQGGEPAIEPAIVEVPAETIVNARRTSYFLSTQAVGQIKGGIAEGGDLNRTRSGARMLARWADVLPTLFPEGTNVEGSRALDTVWTDKEGFAAAAAAYRDAALVIAEKAEAGDRAGANDAFMAMAGTCKACHDKYREE